MYYDIIFVECKQHGGRSKFSFAYGLLVRTNGLPELDMKNYIKMIDFRLTVCL